MLTICWGSLSAWALAFCRYDCAPCVAAARPLSARLAGRPAGWPAGCLPAALLTQAVCWCALRCVLPCARHSRPRLRCAVTAAAARGWLLLAPPAAAPVAEPLCHAKRHCSSAAWPSDPLRDAVRADHAHQVYGDPAMSPQNEDYWGNVNCTGVRSCYDEGKRCAETLFFDYQRQVGVPLPPLLPLLLLLLRCTALTCRPSPAAPAAFSSNLLRWTSPAWHRQHGVDIRVARIFNTYGPGMHPYDGRVVTNFIMQALAGTDITIYGDGSQTRSFCFVEDNIDGLIALMNQVRRERAAGLCAACLFKACCTHC